MKELFGNLKDKMNGMLDDENSILSQTKDKLKDKYIKVPITSDILLLIFKKQELEDIGDLVKI